MIQQKKKFLVRKKFGNENTCAEIWNRYVLKDKANKVELTAKCKRHC